MEKFEQPEENLAEKMALLPDEELMAKIKEYQEKYNDDTDNSEVYLLRSSALKELANRWAGKKINLEMALAEKVSGKKWKEYEKIGDSKQQTEKLIEFAVENNLNPEEI